MINNVRMHRWRTVLGEQEPGWLSMLLCVGEPCFPQGLSSLGGRGRHLIQVPPLGPGGGWGREVAEELGRPLSQEQGRESLEGAVRAR